ncbi:hypothetical protein M5K25_027866 [Dendrobium thyrsiflorum]|uniref:Uncharacterized protein n=1 Tax=Dendrobium thyrsiflorum TaxID=117978 RepID=A0ABD0TUX7_DENTH
MCPGWLCHRSGSSVTLEGYQPNRVARQFGLFQATAFDGRPLVPGVTDTRRMDTVPLETRLYTAALTWLHLLRFGTGSSFLLAQLSAHTGVSYTQLAWVRQSFGPVLEHGARRYERRVQRLGLPRGQRSRQGLSDATCDRVITIFWSNDFLFPALADCPQDVQRRISYPMPKPPMPSRSYRPDEFWVAGGEGKESEMEKHAAGGGGSNFW